MILKSNTTTMKMPHNAEPLQYFYKYSCRFNFSEELF